MALRKSQRYFIERDNQDAKSEFGWDEIQTTSYFDNVTFRVQIGTGAEICESECDYLNAERQEMRPLKETELAKGEQRGAILGHWPRKGQAEVSLHSSRVSLGLGGVPFPIRDGSD